MAEENGGKDLFAGLHMSDSPKHSATQGDENGIPALSSTISTQNPVEVVTRAPVTDKLLAMFGTPPSSPTRSDTSTTRKTTTAEEQSDVKPSAAMNGSHKPAPARDEKMAAAPNHDEEEERKPPATVMTEKNPVKGVEEKVSPPAALVQPSLEEAAENKPLAAVGSPDKTLGKKDDSNKPAAAAAASTTVKAPPFVNTTKAMADQEDAKPSAVHHHQQDERESKRGMPEIDDAFHVVTKEEVVQAVGQVHPETPIPNADAALRVLRKFAAKTRPQIPAVCGGTQTRSMLGNLFGKSLEDITMEPYAQLMEILFDGEEKDDEEDNEDVVVESILGHGSDNMAKARLAIAAFCHMSSVLCHASSRMLDDSKSFLLGHSMDTATALVARGCMDNVMIGVGGGATEEYSQAVEVLAESIFVADLSEERNELAALKFLLTAGCRTCEAQALLRGTHLLQTIRVLYHVYLTTDSKHNKTTARASLQQLITSVFARMISTQQVGNMDRQNSGASGKDSFPSADHRDAFLVLRTMCKLSMRTMPDTSKNGNTGGLQSSGSNTMWDGGTKDAQSRDEGDVPLSPRESSSSAQIATQAMNSALESKILALELLLYVLQNTDMSGGFLLHSGPQFQYAIRNYLCVSLLKNCTSNNTSVVNLSLRLFVPLIQNFRSHLKTEIEAFVTNVFFVILDSKNSTMEHKIRVAILFEEICSDPTTLAEIFLNYDCDLSAVDLFHRIVNTLSRVAKTDEPVKSHFVAGAGATRMEKMRKEQRELRLYAMRALKQVLASLHHSFVDFGNNNTNSTAIGINESFSEVNSTHSSPTRSAMTPSENVASPSADSGKQTLVQIYDSKKKRRQEEAEAVLRFNRKPAAGIAYAVKCGHLDGDSPVEVAKYLLKNKDELEKTQIGEYLGREAQYQNGFSLRVLHAYVNMLDLKDLKFDDAIRYYLSGFRLPGEAQKIDRIMEKFAERYTNQNPSVFPTADAAFILAFSVIMLNTDLHNPAIKEERRMTKEGFIRNNRGICDGQDLPEELLNSIFDRIQSDPISLKEDDEARERVGEGKGSGGTGKGGTSLPSALSPAVLFSSHYDEIDRTRETNFQKERDQIVRTTETLLKRKRHHSVDHGKSHRHYHGKLRSSVQFVRTVDTGLRDEYVVPMFDVTWAPALAAFSTAMESANGTLGSLINIATDEELALAAENAAETTEVCLTGFRLAVCTAGLCGNDTARDAFMLALVSFSQLGTGVLLQHRHIRCVQSLLTLGRDDGELLGNTWEHVFRALSEINRFHQVFHSMARSDRVAAAAEERRKRRLEAQESRRQARERRRLAAQSQDDSVDGLPAEDASTESEESLTDSEEFTDDEPYFYDKSMDKQEIDEANARVVYEAIPESLIDAIYQRSSSLSGPAINEFIFQLCRVSRMEISGYGGHVGSDANAVDLTQIHYRQQHTLLSSSSHGRSDQLHNQPDIYNLQKLVEVTHYNMDSRPRLVFSEIWTPVAAHLTSTALHENAAVAMYAVDSFRQLSFQYLQREELGVFEFQSRFLKPLETVMARSSHVTTKELLLNCVERIILMFGTEEDDDTAEGDPSASPTRSNSGHLGTLRSGWRPVLSVLGIAGHDEDKGIATAGFKLLTSQMRQCLSAEKNDSGDEKAHAGLLIAERFVDLVDSLFMYVTGPHEDISAAAIDQLVALSSFLADENYALPVVRRRPSAPGVSSHDSSEMPSGEELELWWPILLKLSQTVGDSRSAIRRKSLVALFEIINGHFLPSTKPDDQKPQDATEHSVSHNPRHGDLQTLQLIFRGVLTPILYNAESDTDVSSNPPVPPGFVRFITKAPLPPSLDAVQTSWLETTFDPFMDGCIAVCMHSIEVFEDDTLIEEVFALLNSCLLSDSGVLAVRGLHRLQDFVRNGLDDETITDDTHATACHMLRRCLLVRGLNASVLESGSTSPTGGEKVNRLKASEAVKEFIAEEQLFADRRYIGSNAIEVIETLLKSECALDLRWRLFLIKGLGRAVKEWELAADLLESRAPVSGEDIRGPPHYSESALFGRKLIVKYMQKVMSKDLESSRGNEVHCLLEEQTQSLLGAYLQKESSVERTSVPNEVTHLMMLSDLLKELLASYSNADDPSLLRMDWLCPLLTSFARSTDPAVQETVQLILDRALKIGEAKEIDDVERAAADEAVDAVVAPAPTEKMVADV